MQQGEAGRHPAIATLPRNLTSVTPTATLNGQELELFRIGNYGAKGTYTAADMQGIVSRYSSAGETPIAIGHVKSDSEPAYGWLKSVRFSGESLYGTPGDVTPELDELHRQKKYRNHSAAFARDKDGQLYLHHLAVLGAVPPYVQGLKSAKFSSDPFQEIVLSGEGDDMPNEEQLKKSIGEGIAEFFSSLGKKKVEGLSEEDLIAKATAAVEAKFSAELETERTARLAAEAKFSAAHNMSAARIKSDAAIATLKTAGAWIPAYDKLGVPALFSALAERTETITFSDDKGVEQKPDLLKAATDIFSAVGRIVPAGRKTAEGAQGEKSAALPDANGAEVDPDSATFSAMVTEHAQTKNISYNEAYRDLSAQGKRPQSGASSAGAV